MKKFRATLPSLSIALGLSCLPASAENSAFILPFGGEPGAPLAHAYDYGAPPSPKGVYTMRIPVVDPEVASVLHDTELTIDAATKVVQRVSASRAFRAVADCDKARALLNGKVERVLPAPGPGEGPWIHQSSDGRVAGGAWCETARHLPFTTLFLELALRAP